MDEVEGTVETAGKLGHIDGESELLVEKLEHLVLALGGEQVGARADVLLRGLGHELKRKRVARGGDAVGT